MRTSLAGALGAVAAAMAAAPAGADPLAPPTVPYTVDVQITRREDFAVRARARFIFAGRKLRVDYGPLSRLVDFDSNDVTILMPRVSTYWTPQPIDGPADARRWIGVEAETAEPAGHDTILGRPVTRYRVHGRIFDSRTPFDGNVWTTEENIVLKVEGTGHGDGGNSPIRVTAVQLVRGPPDPAVFTIPPKWGLAPKSDTSWRDGD